LQHGHLPDIPSAAEVEEKGIALSDMSAKQLQKIEELTLYAIEQDKRIIELSEQLLEQGKEIQQLKAQSNAPGIKPANYLTVAAAPLLLLALIAAGYSRNKKNSREKQSK